MKSKKNVVFRLIFVYYIYRNEYRKDGLYNAKYVKFIKRRIFADA